MRLLIIGGAGYVGSIVCPTLEEYFQCTHLDQRALAHTHARMIVGDLHDEAILAQALQGQDAVLYLAMAPIGEDQDASANIEPSFHINACGVYRAIRLALAGGVRRFVYASSISVYDHTRRKERWRQGVRQDESIEPDCFRPYGFSKRVGEFVCQAAAMECPDASILSLRLMRPRNETDWQEFHIDPTRGRYPLGAKDMRRLFLAAMKFHLPGFHVVHATGDTIGKFYPSDRAAELLDWRPQNE